MRVLDRPNTDDSLGWVDAIKVGATAAVLFVTPLWLATHAAGWLS